MKIFRLHKLVRDDIVADMQNMGQKVQVRVLGDAEYIESLRQKIHEEIAEFDAASPQPLKELADVHEALEQLVATLGGTMSEVSDLQSQKAKKAGRFKKRMFVETVTLADDDPWVEYYSADPVRFPPVQP